MCALLATKEIAEARKYRDKSLRMERNMGGEAPDPVNQAEAFKFDEEELKVKCDEIIARAKNTGKGGRSKKHCQEAAAADAEAAQQQVAAEPHNHVEAGEQRGEDVDSDADEVQIIASQFNFAEEGVEERQQNDEEIVAWLESEGMIAEGSDESGEENGSDSE